MKRKERQAPLLQPLATPVAAPAAATRRQRARHAALQPLLLLLRSHSFSAAIWCAVWRSRLGPAQAGAHTQ
jgi:hypothetical protein